MSDHRALPGLDDMSDYDRPRSPDDAVEQELVALRAMTSVWMAATRFFSCSIWDMMPEIDRAIETLRGDA